MVAGLALALLLAAPAEAWLALGADTAEQPGQIDLLVWGSGTFTAVDISERVGDVQVPVRTVVPPEIVAADGSIWSGTVYRRSAPWRCDRLTRYFRAVGHRVDGATEISDFNLRTPSCRNRLRMTAPPTAHPGKRVTVRIRDSFELGGVLTRLCIRPPHLGRHCRTLHIEDGRSSVAYAFHARRRGRWHVTLEAPAQRLRAVVSVGVRPLPGTPPLPMVLTTGDSLMENVDAILEDRLTGRARVRSDIHVGSGLGKTFPVRWSELPGGQVRRFRPAATVMFLGTTDGWPMRTPDGAEVACCGEPWIAEYARRARRAMQTYLRGYKGALVWLNIPAGRDPKRKAPVDAVNTGLARAVVGLRRAAVLDMAALFTPGGVYRDFMLDRGRRVRAVRAVMRQLERLGVV